MCPIDYHHWGRRYKQHYACFGCRKTFKARDEFLLVRALRPNGVRLDQVPRQVPCPDCGVVMARMGRQFRAPKRAKVKAWAALATKYGGPRQHLGAPFEEPYWRQERQRRARAAAQAAAR